MDTINSYKCPCCGAPLVFSGSELHCDSCDNTFPVETMQQMSEGMEAAGGESKYDWEHYDPRSYEDTSEINLANYSCPSIEYFLKWKPADKRSSHVVSLILLTEFFVYKIYETVTQNSH